MFITMKYVEVLFYTRRVLEIKSTWYVHGCVDEVVFISIKCPKNSLNLSS